MAEYIEREALIKACKKIIHDRWNETTAPVSWSHAYADFIDDINNQPSADVAPVRHGHWVSEYDCGYITPHCSECGETALTKEETSYDYVYSSYCPHCGAKMDGDTNGS